MSRETNMTVGRPTKLILGLAVPLILTNVGQQLYTVADASIVGRGVGVEALAALGATDWLYCWCVDRAGHDAGLFRARVADLRLKR